MNLTPRFLSSSGMLATWALSVFLSGHAVAPAALADEAALGTPVEDDMHEFMEYVFQPTYLRLKASMAELSASQADWKAIKSDALILAESANLLGGRHSEGETLWQQHATATRQAARHSMQRQRARTSSRLARPMNRC